MNFVKLSGRSLVALIVATYVVMPTRAVAQTPGSIAGTVVDTSGGVIIGAAVTLLDANGSVRGRTTTDAMGMFSLAGIPPGKYVVRVESQPFAEKRVDADVAGGPPANLRVVLEVPAIKETVDVGAKTYVRQVAETATKTDTPILDVPQSVEVIPESLILDRRPASLSEALYNVSGVADGGSRRGCCDFPMIRGFDASTDVFLDGLRVERGNNNVAQEVLGLETVEVIKGPSSLLFGQGALGGVINEISPRPTQTPHATFEATGGAYDFYQGRLDVSGPIAPAVSGRVIVIARHQGDFIDFLGKDRLYVSPSLTWNVSAMTDVTFLGNYTRDRSKGSYVGLPAEGTVLPNVNGPIPRQRNIGEPGWDTFPVDRGQVGYAVVHRFNGVWTLRQNLRFSDSDVLSQLTVDLGLQPDQRTEARGLGEFANTDRSLPVDTNLEGRFATGPVNHTLLVGLDYLNQHVNQSFAFGLHAPIDLFAPKYGLPIEPLFPASTNFSRHDRLAGTYLQDQIQLDKRLTVVVGGRYDATDTTNDDHTKGTSASQNNRSFVPRVGLVYKITPVVAAYTTFARSFNPNFGTDFGGTPFQPERGELYEVGVKTGLANEALTSTVAVYNITRSNVLTPDPNPTHVGSSIQTGEQRSRGFEADVAGRLAGGWNVTSAYAYTDARITRDTMAAGSRPQNVPANLLNLFARYERLGDPVGRVGLGAGLRYVGERQGTQPNTYVLPGYTTVDADVTYRRARITLQLNVYNVFNKDYIASAATLGGLGVLIGEPRTARVSVGYGF